MTGFRQSKTYTCPKRSIANGNIDLITGWSGCSWLGKNLESGKYTIYVSRHDNIELIQDIGLCAIAQREGGML